MKRVRRHTYAGQVLDIEVYTVNNQTASLREPTPRFKDEEARKAFMLARARKYHERLVNANFTPAGYYCTLTFDRENECHTWKETKYLAQLYIRRIKRKYEKAKIMWYAGRGAKTARYHIHMLIENVPEEIIYKQWTYGDVVRVEHLREHNYYNGVDHGRDYTALANYLFDHWTPEQGKHRYRATRNLRKPEREEPKEIKRVYTPEKPPKTPKGYKLVDIHATKYGYICFKYVVDPGKSMNRRAGRKTAMRE